MLKKSFHEKCLLFQAVEIEMLKSAFVYEKSQNFKLKKSDLRWKEKKTR